MSIQNKVIVCILFTVVWIGSCQKAHSQLNSDEPTALVWMTISLEEDMHLTMDMDPETAIALALHKPNDEADLIMYESFELIRGIVSTELGLNLLPHQTLKGKVTYSRLGYPLAGLKKAAKNSDFEQYVKIDIIVSGAKRTTRETSQDLLVVDDFNISEGYSEVDVLPQVDITLNFADGNGKSIGKFRGRYRHTEKVLITTESLQSGNFSIPLQQTAEPIPYYYYLHEAILDLAEKLGS